MKAKDKILIFGGSGFLGKAFLQSLDLDNFEITIADSSKSNIANNSVSYVEVDITDFEEMQSKLDKNYDYVFNFASIADIGEADGNFDKTIDVNVTGCLNTLKFCKTAKISTYIYASSMYVFGDKGGVYGATKKISEMLVEKDITLYSTCEHHFLPIVGKAHIAYISSGNVIGLSKMNRIVEYYAKRPQVQERLTEQIGEAIFNNTQALGAGVVVKAQHMCSSMRGVNLPETEMITSSLFGTFKSDNATRKEFFDLIK